MRTYVVIFVLLSQRGISFTGGSFDIVGGGFGVSGGKQFDPFHGEGGV